jgi:hypothetical protein
MLLSPVWFLWASLSLVAVQCESQTQVQQTQTEKYHGEDCTSPSVSDLSHGIMHTALDSWAGVMREQNSIGVLCLGGSNTFKQMQMKYPELLDKLLKKSSSNDSYALNEGKPGKLTTLFHC